jgi:hypothetical protein
MLTRQNMSDNYFHISIIHYLYPNKLGRSRLQFKDPPKNTDTTSMLRAGIKPATSEFERPTAVRMRGYRDRLYSLPWYDIEK